MLLGTRLGLCLLALSLSFNNASSALNRADGRWQVIPSTQSSFMFRVPFCSLALSLILVCPGAPQSLSSSSFPASPQLSDESAVRAIVEKYFALYAAKDLGGLMNLWSEKSPDLESRKQATQKLFADYD